MSAIIEVFYPLPRDEAQERTITKIVSAYQGHLDYAEQTYIPGVSQTVTLTYVFPDRSKAEKAERAVQEQGFHTERCDDYPAA